MLHGWIFNRPEVLANLRRNLHLGIIFVSENEFSAERIIFAVNRYKPVFIAVRSELTFLVKLVVIRQKRFRYDAEDFSFADSYGAVIKFPVLFKGRTHKCERIVIDRKIGDFYKVFFTRMQKRVHIKQIPRGVPRKSKLGKNENLNALHRIIFERVENALRVFLHVAHFKVGRYRGDAAIRKNRIYARSRINLLFFLSADKVVNAYVQTFRDCRQGFGFDTFRRRREDFVKRSQRDSASLRKLLAGY